MIKKISSVVTAVLICSSVFANSQKELFDRTAKHLDMGGIHFQYQNLENLDEQLHFLIDFCEKTMSNTPSQQMAIKKLLNTLKTLNYKDLQAVGSSTVKLSPTLYSNKFAVTVAPGTAGTLNSLQSRKNFKFRYGRNLPAETILAYGAYWDWNNFYSDLEKSFPDKELFKNYSLMAEQMLGVKLQALAANITGEFFGTLCRGAKPEQMSFAIVIPDSNNLLKQLAVKYLGPTLKQYNDGSLLWTMPVAASDFGSAVNVYFARRQVFIYSGNAKLSELLNTSGSKTKLSAVNPAIFGFLNNIEGSSFMVSNFNPKDFNKQTDSKSYQCGSVCQVTPDGCLVSAKTNFNMHNIIEYKPLLDIITEMIQDTAQEMPQSKKTEEYTPMPL